MYSSIRNFPSMINTDGKPDVLYAIRMREKYGIGVFFTYEDIQNAEFNVLDCVEGTLADSCICEDDNGNVVIFAEKALNCWTSVLIPIMKETAAETWRYWEENFEESEETEI